MLRRPTGTAEETLPFPSSSAGPTTTIPPFPENGRRAHGPLAGNDSLADDLRGIAAAIAPMDASSAERLERLASAVLDPRESELWIDVDGAVGGYIGARPRLLGYLGDDPEGEVARGFFTPHFYICDGAEIVDIDTGARLASDVAATLDSGTSLRVTTYGDLLQIEEDQGVSRVTTVTPATWFSGHLG